jgi:hypothetical protein
MQSKAGLMRFSGTRPPRLCWLRTLTAGSYALAVFAAAACATPVSSAAAAELGTNTYDLELQYVNPATPNKATAAGYRRVRLAMARKAIADARDAGFRFLRLSVSGYFPANFGDRRNDLALWQSGPAAYWADLDHMFADLDRAGIRVVPSFLWQTTQFAVLGHNTLHEFVTEPNCRGRQLFAQYLQEFIARYKDRKTILFYELTNEMNLGADLDLSKGCPKGRPPPCVWDHYSTAELNRFASEAVALIKSLDPTRQVDSGYSMPRPAAWHLIGRPGFAPGGPDWTADTPAQLRDDLILIHQPFDIVSVHIYPIADNNRFGRPPGEEYKLLDDAAAAARAAKKPLFVGEFGDTGVTPFMTNFLQGLVRDKVAYAAIWVWEYYQLSTYRTHDTAADRSSLEPGDGDRLINLLVRTEQKIGAPPPPAPQPGAPPRVVLTWPLACAAINQPIELYAVASAAGAHAVKSVDFLVDGKMIGTATTFPYAAHFDPGGLGPREVAITARATAASGATADFASPVMLNGAPAAACAAPAR